MTHHTTARSRVSGYCPEGCWRTCSASGSCPSCRHCASLRPPAVWEAETRPVPEASCMWKPRPHQVSAQGLSHVALTQVLAPAPAPAPGFARGSPCPSAGPVKTASAENHRSPRTHPWAWRCRGACPLLGARTTLVDARGLAAVRTCRGCRSGPGPFGTRRPWPGSGRVTVTWRSWELRACPSHPHRRARQWQWRLAHPRPAVAFHQCAPPPPSARWLQARWTPACRNVLPNRNSGYGRGPAG